MVKPYVAVIGTSEPTPSEFDLARDVGTLLAHAGAVLVSGGRGGVMEASCQGAFAAGGTTVGVLPGNHRSEGNQYLTVAVATGLGQLRNGLVVAAADAVIAIGGGWGTLTEIGFAMRAGKPLIALNAWQVAAPYPSDRPIITAGSAEEAVRLALEVLTKSLDVAVGDDAGGQGEECFVDVVASFPADAEPFHAVVPGDGALDNPPERAEAGAVRDAAAGDVGPDFPEP